MSIPIPFSVTVEDAVARMVNMDYIPEGFTLAEMTAAFLEEAEVEHHNAIVNLLPAGEIAALQIRMDACAARHSLTKLLLDAIRNEIGNPEGLIVVTSDASDIEQHITFESLTKWASMYGIGSLGWAYSDADTDNTALAKNVRWEDVTIKIYADYRIAYFSEQTGPKGIEKTFRDIDLMGKRKNRPNFLGGILIVLSRGEKFPAGNSSKGASATAISKIRSALKQLTGLTSEPFYPFNIGEGYRPRFTLIDDRRNADERAKKRAVHVSHDEKKNHNTGNDYSGNSEEEFPDTDDFNNTDVDPADSDTDAITNKWLAQNN